MLVKDNCFRDQHVTVGAGAAVRWVLDSALPHTVTFDGGGPDSGTLDGTFEIRFNEPGTYAYSCVFHKGMTGSIDVMGVANAGESFEVVTGKDWTLAGGREDLPVRAGGGPETDAPMGTGVARAIAATLLAIGIVGVAVLGSRRGDRPGPEE